MMVYVVLEVLDQSSRPDILRNDGGSHGTRAFVDIHAGVLSRIPFVTGSKLAPTLAWPSQIVNLPARVRRGSQAAHPSRRRTMCLGDGVGASWRARYDGLRLNTPAWMSTMPGTVRATVVTENIRPVTTGSVPPGLVDHHRIDVRFGTPVHKVMRRLVAGSGNQ